MSDFSITFYGVGGSTSISTDKRLQYGCNTYCALVKAGSNNIILDMGTGLIQLSNAEKIVSADILLSHFHYDHISGLLFFPITCEPCRITIHAEQRSGKTTKELIEEFIRPPFFPVTPKSFSSGVTYCQFRENDSFYIGENKDILVETTRTFHPNISTAYKIHYADKILVTLIDHEHSRFFDSKITEFCRNADLVVYDATYTEQEYNSKNLHGFGHSTHEKGLELAERANIKKIVFAHHDFRKTDNQLDEIANRISQHSNTAIMAKERQTIDI